MGWMWTARCDVGVGGLGVHGVEDAVDGFVAAGAEDVGAEDLLGVGVDEDLDEAFGFAFFDGAADAGHGAGADEGWLSGFADFGFGEADAAEGRVGVEGVAEDAVGDAAGIVVEEVGGDDFEVVVGGVGEGAAAVAVAHGPDAGDVGAELVVDGDVAAVVGATPAFSRPRSSVLGRRPTARRMWEPMLSGRSSSQSTPAAMSLPSRRKWMHSALGRIWMPSFSRKDRMAAETSSSSRETRRGRFFDDGDFAAEAAEHLREFEADVAAADDDEMAREGVEFEDADVGEIGDFIDAGQVGDVGAAAYVEEDLRRRRGDRRRRGPRWGTRSGRGR